MTGPLRRVADWEWRLGEIVERTKGAPLVWGVSDCALFVGDVIEAMTGVDLAAPYRGIYATRAAAKALLKREVGGYVGALCEAMAAAGVVRPAESVRHAQRGDVVLWAYEDAELIGVVWLDGRQIVCRDLEGVAFVPVRKGSAAWHV